MTFEMPDISDPASVWAKLSNDTTLSTHLLVPPPTTLSVGCVEDSLSYGFWQIDDFKYSQGSPDDATSNTFSFGISSPIDDWRFTCAFAGGEGVLEKGCVPDDESTLLTRRVDWFMAEWAPERDSATLAISMSWECDGSGIAFAAVSEAQIPVTVDENDSQITIEADSQVEIPYTLNTPVDLTPALEIPPPPPGSRDPSCRAASQSPTWEISDITWRWSPSVRPEAPPAAFQVKITNSVTGQTTSCVGLGSGIAPGPRTNPGAFGPGKPFWHDCDREVWADEYGWEYKTQAAIKWSGWEETLEIAETWFCDGEDGEAPVKYVGYTQVDLTPDDFVCGSAPDPGAVRGEGESGLISPPVLTVCSPIWDSKELPGIIIGDFDLVPRAFDFGKPHADGCLISSLDPDNHYWDFYTNSFTVQPDDNGTRRIRAALQMGVTNGYPGGVFNCSDPFSEPSGSGYCENPPLPGAHWSSQKIAYDEEERVFSIEQLWQCKDRSSESSIVFKVTGTADIPELTCQEDGVCVVDDGGEGDTGESIKIPMDITWHTE